MFFRQNLHEEKSCLSYLVGCKTQGECAVIDPQGDPEKYIETVKENEMEIAAVIETHVQADHYSSAENLGELTGAPVYFGSDTQASFSHKELKEGDELQVGNRIIKILKTPGHTEDHICLYVDDWFLITGDTLFVGDVGRVDLALSDESQGLVKEKARRLYESLQRLITFPEWTEVYPGHYAGSVCGRGMDGKPITTIGREKQKNKSLQLTKEEFIEFQLSNLPPLPPDFVKIKLQNLGRAAS